MFIKIARKCRTTTHKKTDIQKADQTGSASKMGPKGLQSELSGHLEHWHLGPIGRSSARLKAHAAYINANI